MNQPRLRFDFLNAAISFEMTEADRGQCELPATSCPPHPALL